MSLLETLNAMLPKEAKILGATPEEAEKIIDLSVAYTPVLDNFILREDELYHMIPKPVRVVKDGLRYCLMPGGSEYRWLDIEELKRKRARYILVKNWYYVNFKKLSYPEQQEVLGKFFKDGMWRPKEGSELSKLMGLEPA